jgi:nucleoid-associated protein YgaU
MECPVCQRRDIPAEAQVCPQCDADLRGLRLVSEFKSTSVPVPVASARPAWPLVLVAVGLLGAGLLLGRGIAPADATTTSVVPVSAVAPGARDELQALRDSIRSLRANTAVAPGNAETRAFTYVVRRGDTLRGIAWRLYGRASLAERLQQENNISNPRRLPIGRRLRLFTL